MDKLKILNEIKAFLDGYNEDLKYIVHVEANPNESYAECIVHPPGSEKEILKVEYTPFMYVKDFKRLGITLYHGDERLQKEKMIQHGVKIKKLKTGNQKRLEDGYCYKVTSTKSYNSIINFFRDGGIYPYEKKTDDDGNYVRDNKGEYIYLYRDLFFATKPYEQFLIDKRARLFKGFEEYKDVHRVIFDIETTGLRYEISRVFAIGVRDNRGFETTLRVEKVNDDDSERNLIRDFFNLILYLNPAVVGGHNSEEFDFHYILGRAKKLKMNLDLIPTTLKKDVKLRRIPNSSVKIGNTGEKYTATQIWGMSVIDTLHAAKKTAAVNTDLKMTNLKYVAKFEGFAKENRTYIAGEDDQIGRYYHENPIFVANDKNEHIEVPTKYQKTAKDLLKVQNNKETLSSEQYKQYKKLILDKDPEFVSWFRRDAVPQKMHKFIHGRKLVGQYLLDDLYETEQVDELYNQSSFMLAKIVPTVYSRICTMGTASVWNLLLTAWSYEYDLAIPHSDEFKKFSGGLSRCYKKGYTKRLVKIDYASLYPMLQLTWDIFPIFDITGVLKKMLTYLTTTRNIYKKLGKGKPLNKEEEELMKGIDHEMYMKYVSNSLTAKDRAMFDIKQLPIKILNNSLFGALGSNIVFNWSDNVCAARITSCGRIELRHAINWFEQFGCIPLYAVTDGVNFHIPNNTHIIVNNNGIDFSAKDEAPIEEMWKYGDKVGVDALIEYFNNHEMKPPFMAVDNDGEFVSCFNLARINYAVLQEVKDKKTGEIKKKIKYTGNTIKSSVMPEYIQDFMDNGFQLILEGKGPEFVDYYHDYVQELYYKQIPLKKIANKSKFKHTLKQYDNRGTDKNGRKKAKQAHMELIIEHRNKIAEKLFQEHKEELEFKKDEEKLTIEDKVKLVDVYMPPEPALDSTIYYYNTGYRKSHGDSKEIKDKDTGEMRFAATLIDKEQLIENPDLTGDYNVDKYLDAFNSRVKSMFIAFEPEIAEKAIAKIVRKKVKDDITGKKVEREELVINQFTRDQLELKSFDLDDVDESMYLEKKEVQFWNETGYDPRLVWDGFKMHNDMKVHYEIYEGALKFLNDAMASKGDKRRVKSRNEELENGDLVLIKNGRNYSVGAYNGQYIEIVRSDVKIPKSEIELKLDEEEKKREEAVKKLDTKVDFKTVEEAKLEVLKEKRNKYFPSFKKKFNIKEDTISEFDINTDGMGLSMIDEFIKIEEENIEQTNLDYIDVD